MSHLEDLDQTHAADEETLRRMEEELKKYERELEMAKPPKTDYAADEETLRILKEEFKKCERELEMAKPPKTELTASAPSRLREENRQRAATVGTPTLAKASSETPATTGATRRSLLLQKFLLVRGIKAAKWRRLDLPLPIQPTVRDVRTALAAAEGEDAERVSLCRWKGTVGGECVVRVVDTDGSFEWSVHQNSKAQFGDATGQLFKVEEVKDLCLPEQKDDDEVFLIVPETVNLVYWL